MTRERRDSKTRVAATPETVKKLVALGFSVVVETGAGSVVTHDVPAGRLVKGVPARDSRAAGPKTREDAQSEDADGKE